MRSTRRASSSSSRRSIPTTWLASRPRSTRSINAASTSCGTRDNEKLFIAEAGNLVFSTHLVLRSALLREWVAGPVFTGLARDIIGPDVRLYWEQAVYKEPEKPRSFPWHQDNGYTFIEPQQYLTCWVALTDATVENGCPWVIPGLHRLGTLEHWMTDYGWECLDRPAGAVAGPGARGRHRRVLVAHAAPHRTEHERRGAQGLHRAVRARRGCGERTGCRR